MLRYIITRGHGHIQCLACMQQGDGLALGTGMLVVALRGVQEEARRHQQVLHGRFST